mgnify:CR=1 FL=1
MPFFARPDLSNEQFKQLSGSTLTLSGTTQIANPVGGLEFIDEYSQPIPVIVTGATEESVLTYVGGCLILKQPTSGASTGVYTCASPTTCTVGGLNAGTSISGCTIGYILERILVPTLNPTVTPPSSTFTVTCLPLTSTGYYEIGTVVCVCGCSCFNRGCVSPVYCGCDKRSNLPIYHCFNNWGIGIPAYTSSLSTGFTFTPHPVSNAIQTVSGRVFYGAATWCVLNSSGGIFCTPLPSGCTVSVVRTILALYPYFYGKIASGGCPAGVCRPTPTTICSCIIAGCGKTVDLSTGTICINFGSSSDDYIWFAIPNASTSKTKWYVDTVNNGCIGGAVSPGGNLFPDFSSVADITTSCWSGQTYKVYVSNYQTAVSTIMELRNS